MKTKIDIDKLIQSTVRDSGIDAPGGDFADKVMASLPTPSFMARGYQPLISQKMLWIIFSVLAVLITGIILLPSNQAGIFSNFSIFEKIQGLASGFHFNFQLSPLAVSIIGSAFVLLLLQAFIISRYFRSSHR